MLKVAEVEIPSLKECFKNKLFPSHREISRKMISETTSSISEGVLLAEDLHSFSKCRSSGTPPSPIPSEDSVGPNPSGQGSMIRLHLQLLPMTWGFTKERKYRAWVKLPALITCQSASWKMSFFFRKKNVSLSSSHTCYTYSTDVYHFLVYLHMWFWILETKLCYSQKSRAALHLAFHIQFAPISFQQSTIQSLGGYGKREIVLARVKSNRIKERNLEFQCRLQGQSLEFPHKNPISISASCQFLVKMSGKCQRLF